MLSKVKHCSHTHVYLEKAASCLAAASDTTFLLLSFDRSNSLGNFQIKMPFKKWKTFLQNARHGATIHRVVEKMLKL